MSSVHSAEYQLLLKRLRKARHRAGLTQAGVAHALARPQSYVSKCESGERRMDAIELQHFAKLYGKSVSFLLRPKKKH